MSLRLICGRAGSGKSHFCLNDIKSKFTDGSSNPLILVVPEQFTLQAEKNLIKTLGIGGTIRAEVLSFRRMAYRVFNEVGGMTHRHINSAGKCMLVYRAVDGIKEQLKVFSASAGRPGFVKTLLEVIAELKMYDITPEGAKNLCGSIKENGFLKEKLEDICLIYDEYEKLLHEKNIDSEDDMAEFAGKLDRSVQFDGAEIWIDEFSGFTPQEYKVVGKLLKKASRINVSLCTDGLPADCSPDDTDVFCSVKNTASKLIKLAKENNTVLETEVSLEGEPCCRFVDSEEIAHLERQFFSFPYHSYPQTTKDIGIFSAENIFAEVENTARDIIRLCRDRGLRFRDIAVVSGNLAGYEKLIGAIFKEYGIPYFIDSKRDIKNHPLILTVLSALEIFSQNWSYESVFRFLKTGLTGIHREDIDIIENYVLACGIRGSRWTREEAWDFRIRPGYEKEEIDPYEKNIIEKVNEIRPRIVDPLMNFRSKTRGRKEAREVCTALYELLCETGVPEKIEGIVDELRASGELSLANEYSQVWNIVMDVFDQVVEVMGNEAVTLNYFGEILKIGFGEYKIGLIPPAVDQVQVGNIERSKSHDISALYILGVNDGVFPSARGEEGVLSDTDRERLRSGGLELAGDTRNKAFEEQYLIYTALTTAGKYLRLSYPIADHEGKTRRPSIIISRLKKIFPAIHEESSIAGAPGEDREIELVAARIPAFNDFVSAVRRKIEGMEVNPLWWDVYLWYKQRDEWKEKCRAVLSGVSYSNQVKHIDTEKARKLYGSPVYSSVSRLEKFAACPFSFYVQYGLKAQERKIFNLSAPDLGTFMHAVLDNFSRLLEEKGLSWRGIDREWCTAAVSEIVDDLLRRMPGSVMNSSPRYRHLSGRLKRVLSRSVWLISEHFRRSGFEPLGYELDFGENGKLPPITVELPWGEKVYLTGRIDRIDALRAKEGTYIRIIDYKSGSKALKLSDFYYGLQIQLAAYLDAVWENRDGGLPSPVIPGGILYFKLDDPIVGGKNGAQEEDIERAIMKQLRMRGLLLADVNLVKEMDRQIDGESLIIPARMNKGEVLGKSSVATAAQFDMLRRFVKKLLSGMCSEMLRGEASIRPYKKKRITSCAYCSFSSICQFDPVLRDNGFRILSDKKDDEVWGLIQNDLSGHRNL